MKVYITYLWVDIWACTCPDVPHGAFLNKEDAEKLAFHNFKEYCEVWKDMKDFEIKQESPDRYEIWADHAYFTSYVEEYELITDVDLSEIKDNKTSIYFMRPDVTKPHEMPYMAFTNKEDAKHHVDKWFNKYAEIAKDKPNCDINEGIEGDDEASYYQGKTVYYDGFYGVFYMDLIWLVTNLKNYLEKKE